MYDKLDPVRASLHAEEELKRWTPGEGVDGDAVRAAALCLAHTMAEVFTKDAGYDRVIMHLAFQSIFSLLSPLEAGDFDADGACSRAVTCTRTGEGKYLFDLGRVYFFDGRVDTERPQRFVEFEVPGMPPKPEVIQTRKACGDCSRDGGDCSRCANVIRAEVKDVQ
jgi:hypothetical protein